VNRANAFIALVLLLLFSGCRHEQPRTVIARVGDAELTLEEARLHIDTAHSGAQSQLQDYVSSWVNTELVYQEAKHHGFDRSPKIQEQLDDIKRQLVKQAYLAEQVFPDTGSLNDQQLHDYFAAHASEFFLSEDMMKLNLIVFTDRTSASTLAASVSRGEDWNQALQRTLRDSTASANVKSYTSNEYYSEHTLFPPELWKVVAGLNTGEITFPVKTSMGYYVLQMLSRLKQGTPAEFDLVKEEVRRRLLLERHRTKYADLLGTLRKNYNVEILLGMYSHHDTTSVQPNE
jgi:hypothetical protein